MVWYDFMAPPAPRATNQLDAKGDDLPGSLLPTIFGACSKWALPYGPAI